MDVPVTPAPTTMTSGDRRDRGDHHIPLPTTVETRPCIAWRFEGPAPPGRALDILVVSGHSCQKACRYGPLMRNLLGRLHARHLSELLRIAQAWGVPVQVETKSEVVGALYRAMSDPRAMRDVWERLDPAEQAVAQTLANLPESAAPPTLPELATHLGVPEDEAREAALRLFRRGMLTREGDDEPLPIGASPRLLLPRELAQGIRRIQDEMAAGDLTRTPLRVLIELLDDVELERAASVWGLRPVAGIARRPDLARRLLRLINDAVRVDRVVKSRGRDAAAIWRVVQAEEGPVPLRDVASAADLGGTDTLSVARLRAALTELESALLVWHAYRDGARVLFVPSEIRSPGTTSRDELPSLVVPEQREQPVAAWIHPDAVAWDLLTLLRTVGDPHAPHWDPTTSPPRWLARTAAHRFWHRTPEGPPPGYLELLLELGLGEGFLAVDEESQPPRVIVGPQARTWRGQSFNAQTARLRERWLRLRQWVEGEPVGLVEVWGADWRGMRPRLLSALGDARIDIAGGQTVTLESLAARLAAANPSLLGPSFMAATARLSGDVQAGASEEEARQAALADVIAIELLGAFAWFGLTEVVDAPGHAQAIRLTERGATLAARKPVPESPPPPVSEAPLVVDPSGEITLRGPTPERVWALMAFAEQVDLGRESHYRLTPTSIAAALEAGAEVGQINNLLARGSRQPVPDELSSKLLGWVRNYRQARLQRAIVVSVEKADDREALLSALSGRDWKVDALGPTSVLVQLSHVPDAVADEDENVIAVLRAVGFVPRWSEGLGSIEVQVAVAGSDV